MGGTSNRTAGVRSGIERIGRTVTVEAAQKGCFGKVRYDSRNAARDRATKYRKKYPDEPKQRPYRCTLCGAFHLTTQVPYGLRRGKGATQNGRPAKGAEQSASLPKEG